jgi:hypothetical protein
MENYIEDPVYCEKCDIETSALQLASCGMCENCHEDYIQEQIMREYLIDSGYFCCPNGELWTHKDFEKGYGRCDWFSLNEAFRHEREFNNE